ncbi:ASCH domain-containing protein [Vibrio fluvialis]|uniref:ASCH domain-containing protein n=1 Tax=Vibrio fluvialis TaxID=676 RepID=UPI00192AD816|nr:ASCH domain-containing protein [Vibrio fluvialis]MBL4278807.1 ASCH domain-containing protein [Vibrio fluvialis]
MKVKPMIFNTKMVKALLDGRKTVTRRPVKFSRGENWHLSIVDGKLCESLRNFKPMPTGIQFPCNIGDLLYVRETFRLYNNSDECGCSDHCNCPASGIPLYFATHGDSESKWKPSIHMPRSISRITLKVTDVRTEKLNDLRKSDEQVKKEGFENWPQFKHVWESIYGQSKPNDYVWVIEFELIHQNVDKYLSSLSLSEQQS